MPYKFEPKLKKTLNFLASPSKKAGTIPSLLETIHTLKEKKEEAYIQLLYARRRQSFVLWNKQYSIAHISLFFRKHILMST